MVALKDLLSVLQDGPYLRPLFNEIRQKGPIKRSQVGLYLPVSKPTRYELIGKLMAASLVVEVPSRDRRKEKRGSLIDVAGNDLYVFGIDIHMHGVTIVLMDLKTRTPARRFFPNEISETTHISMDDKNAVLERLQRGLLELMGEHHLEAENIAGCGISDAGMIDQKEGISVCYKNIPDWIDVPVCSIVSRIVQAPVTLFRDANVMAAAEIRALNIGDVGNLICISLRHGIAVGTFINGQIYLGESGNAGLWGLSRAHLSHARPLPNHHDELDRVLGINALKQVFKQVYGRSGSNEEVVTSVFAAYEAGEETVVQALDEYIVDLGSHIAELGYLFDISQFILTGYFVHCGEAFLRALTQVTREHLSTFRKHCVRIQKGMMGSEAAAWGAAYLVQEHLFK